MGYFSNQTENDIYTATYCSKCAHNENDACPVMFLHFLNNYDECNNENSFLHELIPRKKEGTGNEKCKMFIES